MSYATPADRCQEGADLIDSRDIIARIEELEEERDDWDDNTSIAHQAWVDEFPDEAQELLALKALASECEGYGDWNHGEVLIAEHYFAHYAEDLASDLSDYNPREARWPYTCIDWEKAAEDLKQDYAEVTFGSTTYLIRA